MPKNKLILAAAIALMIISSFVATGQQGQQGQQRQQGDKKQKPIVDYEADVAKQVKDTIIRLIGSVVFHHNGAIIQCDSAYRYSDKRMDCFGNVIINQDSTYIYGDKVTYDGAVDLATVYSPLIKLTSGTNTVMYTYSLTFNTLTQVGEFSGGGIVIQSDNFMEADNGKFYGKINEIKLENNVALRNVDYQIKTDSLRFNLDTEVTTFLTDTYIWDKEHDFLTSKSGTYERKNQTYTFTDKAYLMTKDQEVWADSIIYHSLTREALLRSNAQILDTAQSTIVFGDWGYYNDSIKRAIMSRNPSVRSWDKSNDSTKIDTAYLRADSIYFETFPRGTTKPVVDSTQIEEDTKTLVADSLAPKVVDSLAMDSMVLNVLDTTLMPKDTLTYTSQKIDTILRTPVADSIAIEEPFVVDSLTVVGDSLRLTERIDTLAIADTLSDTLMLPNDTLPATKSDKDTTERLLRAFKNVRLFRTDFQAKCDSLVGYSVDSTMSMFGRPVLWNENNQITANQIDVYTKDDNMDWADFIGNPFVSQQIDTSRYNQAKGRTLQAYFKDNEIDMTHMKGNVLNYYWWEEQDGEVVGFATMESAEMEMYFAGREPEKMKWIGQGTWAIYPLDQIPAEQPLRIEGFEWITQGRATQPSDICTRVEQASIRSTVEGYTKPLFEIEKKILGYREELLKGGKWQDRIDIPIRTAEDFINREGFDSLP